MCRPYKRTPGFLAAFRLTQMKGIFADFHNHVIVWASIPSTGVLSWGAHYGAETLCTSGTFSIVEIFLWIHGYRTSPFCISATSAWLLLCILSYRVSIQQVFRCFSRLTVLSLSCNFGVTMGGGKYSILLLCQLYQNPNINIYLVISCVRHCSRSFTYTTSFNLFTIICNRSESICHSSNI